LESSQSTARTYGALGTVLGIAGVAGVGAGVVLLLQPRSPAPAAQIAVAPWAFASGAGLSGAATW
jgi:hypothetical protein